MTTLNGSGVRVLLIGTHTGAPEYGLSQVPAVRRTLDNLAEALIQRCGLPPEHMTVLFDPANPTDLGLVIADEAERAEEVLLVYYVGHGMVSAGGQLYLATQATDRRHTRLAHTALAYSAVRDSLLESTARSIIIILDCCFSGRAIGMLNDSNSNVADLTQVYGGYVLTSAARDQLALAPPDQPYTAFSGELIRFLNEGDPQAPPELTLRDAYAYLSRVLPAQGFPRPHQRVSEGIEDLVLAPNPAFRKLAPASENDDSVTTLGDNSAERTRGILDSIERRGRRLQYVGDPSAVREFRDFLATSSRIFAIKGSSGTGKTRLVSHLAQTLHEEADFQLHTLESWDINAVNIAVEILRYGSIPQGEDGLLTLEGAASRLSRPFVVVVDGIGTRAHLDRVGRQIDSVIRQVAEDRFKFCLAIRTPPDLGFSPFPVLASALYEPNVRSPGTSYEVTGWDERTARDAWAVSRAEDDPPFAELPNRIRQLAQLPLYMELLKSAGATASLRETNAYLLIGHCVRSIVRASGRDPEQVFEALGDLAQQQLSYLIPSQLLSGTPHTMDTGISGVIGTDLSPLIERSSSGRWAFGHDLIREHALATQIAKLMVAQGRSNNTVSALNDLAVQSTTSATARGLFEFVVYAIDSHSPELAAAFALAPTVAVTTTLPIMLRLAQAGTHFASDEVLIASARRCANDSAIEVARSLLAIPNVATALGAGYASWILTVLDRFGARIWPEVAAHIEKTLAVQAVETLLTAVQFDQPSHATFLARYFFLFADGGLHQAAALEQLLNHSDWRVRAALAESLVDGGSWNESLSARIANRLVDDEDYKVRAAIAKSIGRIASTFLWPQFASLLGDSNWHVRASFLEGLLDAGSSAAVIEGLTLVAADDSWQGGSLRAHSLAARLELLFGTANLTADRAAQDRALRRLLREHRTRWTQLPDDTVRALTTRARESEDWLTRREGFSIERESAPTSASTTARFNPRETYRRLRGGRAIQVALDLHNLDRAVEVAVAAANAGADFIEIGDPLIKTAGLAAIEQIRKQVSDSLVVAEMMSADWGRDQVELAVEAGADVVFLIGPASSASVAAAAEAGRRLGAPILLDVPATQLTESWVHEMERAGVDGFTVTTNIDQGIGGQQPLGKAAAARSWTRLPVAVSGGFSTLDHPIINSNDWDILIVGRSIAEAVDPEQAARHMVTMVRAQRG
jgi:3-keto-L-gulonate-6-phosphate decarboxylase